MKRPSLLSQILALNLLMVISIAAALIEFARSTGADGWRRLAGRALVLALFGVAFASLLSATALARLGRLVAALTAVASIGLGVFWIYAA